jgi:ABC-2 type transport system permease protein
MNAFAFLKKEINEIIKTNKIYILPAVFLFFGLLSPLTAKFTPQILKAFAKSDEMTFIFTKEPSFIDSYAQLFNNISQLCFIVILVFAGTIVGEKVKGTAILVLTKPVSRAKFIISKFIAAIGLYTAAFILATVACVYYTYLLFPVFYNDKLPLSLFTLWIFGVFLISMTIFISTISKSFTVSAVLGIAGFLVISATTAIPYVKKVTPGIFGSLGVEILSAKSLPIDAIAPLITAVVISVGFIVGSIYVFKRQEI